MNVSTGKRKVTFTIHLVTLVEVVVCSIYLISFSKKWQSSYRFLCPKNKNVINYYNKNQFDYLIALIALCKADRDDLYL